MPKYVHVLISPLVSVLRCVFAGVFPLFGEKLFQKLGVDWGVALLAFLVLGVGLPLITLVRVRVLLSYCS
jgi:branched-subunit amino acid permease